MCPRWKKEVKRNTTTMNDYNNFVTSPLISSIVSNVSARLELPDGFLQRNDVFMIYTVCAFETAWDATIHSPWCDVLTIDEFKIIEFSEDIKYFARDGGGSKITSEIACTLFNDAIKHLEQVETLIHFLRQNDNDKSIVFSFTHSGTILKFLTFLHLYQDKYPLNAENFNKLNDRLWRISNIDAFGSNIVFVRYDCNDGSKYILTLHQGYPIKLPWCHHRGESNLCPLNEIKNYFTKYISDCDINKMCSVGDSYFHIFTKGLYNFYNRFRKVFFL